MWNSWACLWLMTLTILPACSSVRMGLGLRLAAPLLRWPKPCFAVPHVGRPGVVGGSRPPD